jgi:hypothetical protein
MESKRFWMRTRVPAKKWRSALDVGIDDDAGLIHTSSAEGSDSV